jgi:response regulator of citrate/malate metabolism
MDLKQIEVDKTNWHRPRILSDVHVGMILAWRHDNVSVKEIAKRLSVSEITVRRYLAEWNARQKEGSRT